MRIRSFGVAVCAATALLASSPAASAWEPAGGPVFNDPSGTTAEQWRIIWTIDDAVRNALPGSRILLSSYLMDSRSTADALIDAHLRGVQVQMVLDGARADNDESRRVANVLNQDNIDPATGEAPRDADGEVLQWGPDNSFVRYCRKSCRGDYRGINHAKFYVFTATGTARDVVMVSSSNLNQNGAVRGWNDLYTVKSAPQVVADFASVHEEMARDRPVPTERYREFTNGRFGYRFLPTSEPRDPRLEDLAKVQCVGATDGAGRKGRTAINISMFLWKGQAGVELARRVVRLDRQGCDVSVIYALPDKEVRGILNRSARRGEVKVWNSRIDRNRDGRIDFRVHEKYMLVNGVYDGDTSSWRVHTGTLNWAGGSLTGSDDNTLTIASRATYRQYLANWRLIRRDWAHRLR